MLVSNFKVNFCYYHQGAPDHTLGITGIETCGISMNFDYYCILSCNTFVCSCL